jgi:hypothetical protein
MNLKKSEVIFVVNGIAQHFGKPTFSITSVTDHSTPDGGAIVL